jgi:hypothetical protein
MRLVGLVSRKDLLHIRREARNAEDARIAYFRARRPPAVGQSMTALPERRPQKKPRAARGKSAG